MDGSARRCRRWTGGMAQRRQARQRNEDRTLQASAEISSSLPRNLSDGLRNASPAMHGHNTQTRARGSQKYRLARKKVSPSNSPAQRIKRCRKAIAAFERAQAAMQRCRCHECRLPRIAPPSALSLRNSGAEEPPWRIGRRSRGVSEIGTTGQCSLFERVLCCATTLCEAAPRYGTLCCWVGCSDSSPAALSDPALPSDIRDPRISLALRLPDSSAPPCPPVRHELLILGHLSDPIRYTWILEPSGRVHRSGEVVGGDGVHRTGVFMRPRPGSHRRFILVSILCCPRMQPLYHRASGHLFLSSMPQLCVHHPGFRTSEPM